MIQRDGGESHPRELAQLPDGVELPGGGSLFIGEGSTMVLPHIECQLWSRSEIQRLQDLEEAPSSARGSTPSSATKTSDGFHYAGPLTETVQLGNIAHKSAKTLEWDAMALKITILPRRTHG